MSYHITSHHITSCHVTSYHIKSSPCPGPTYLVVVFFASNGHPRLMLGSQSMSHLRGDGDDGDDGGGDGGGGGERVG